MLLGSLGARRTSAAFLYRLADCAATSIGDGYAGHNRSILTTLSALRLAASIATTAPTVTVSTATSIAATRTVAVATTGTAPVSPVVALAPAATALPAFREAALLRDEDADALLGSNYMLIAGAKSEAGEALSALDFFIFQYFE
jgi:hypothetical protein